MTAAFELENYKTSQAQHHRREAVCAALDRELSQMAETQGPLIQREMANQLAAWDRAIARGAQPIPPTFRLRSAERPPTGVWDAAVSTDSIELIEPGLFFELARFYNRAKSVGDLYQRYAISAQTDIWPQLDKGSEAFWIDDELRPDIAAVIQRLRDFRERQSELGKEAFTLRAKLRNDCSA